MLLAAVPLQGFAAVSMALCGQDSAAAAPSHHEQAREGAAHAHHEAGAGEAAPDGAEALGHACSICASCCSAAALPVAAQASPVLVAGHPFASGPTGSLVEQPTSVIERPPRA